MADTVDVTPKEPTPVAVVPRVTWVSYLTRHPLHQWSNDDVQNWLVEVGLSHLSPVFARLNGSGLHALTDRLIDEILSTNNAAVKELGSAFQTADKVLFRMHYETLRADSPFLYKLYSFVTSIFENLPHKIHNEIINKLSSKTVETLVKYTALGIATVATSYVAVGWVHPTKSKKRHEE